MLTNISNGHAKVHFTTPRSHQEFLHTNLNQEINLIHFWVDFFLKIFFDRNFPTEIFTADLRRQLANDHCNSLAFFSLFSGNGLAFFAELRTNVARNLSSVALFCFALNTFLAALRNFGRPSRNLASKAFFLQTCIRNMAYNSYLGRQYFALFLLVPLLSFLKI